MKTTRYDNDIPIEDDVYPEDVVIGRGVDNADQQYVRDKLASKYFILFCIRVCSASLLL